MIKLHITALLIVIFTFFISCGVYSQERTLREKFSNFGIDKVMMKLPAPAIYSSDEKLKKSSTNNPSRGESTSGSLFLLGGDLGYLSVINALGCVEINKENLKVTVGDIKEELLKMGFKPSTVQSLDELDDLIDSVKTSSPAMETKLLNIYKEIEKWIIKEQGKDRLSYFIFGLKCSQCTTLTTLAISDKPKREKVCKAISEEFSSTFNELKKEFEEDEQMPGAARKALNTVVDALGNMKSNPGDQEKNLKRLKRAITNIYEAMEVSQLFQYNALLPLFQFLHNNRPVSPLSINLKRQCD